MIEFRITPEELRELAWRWYKTCPNTSENKNLLFFCSMMSEKWAAESINDLIQWGIETPIPTYRTYKDDYFEKYPNAPRSITGDGYPKVAVPEVYNVEHSKNPSGTYFSWYQMWDAEYGTHKEKHA